MGKDALSKMNKGNYPDSIGISALKDRDLRYGTNPSQTAALYSSKPGTFLGTLQELKTGKEGPSQTNMEDIFYAALTLGYFDAPSAIIMKHENPSGFATQYEYAEEALARTYMKAVDGDFRAAFGGTVMLNRPVDLDTAAAMQELFTEVLVAPDFDEGVAGSFKGSIRIFRYNPDAYKAIPRFTGDNFSHEVKVLPDGSVIVADPLLSPIRLIDDLRNHIVSQRRPTYRELQDLMTAYRIRLRSNSIRFVKDGYTTGLGTGQQDRVSCINVAALKNNELLKLAQLENRERVADYSLAGSSMASDGFFAKRDSIDRAHELGITAILAPHGGKEFDNVLAAADEYGIAFVDLPADLRFFDHH